MKNIVYRDLEEEFTRIKHLNIEDVIHLVKKYPKDLELGREIRKLIDN
jgi:hypothetical protein